MAAGRPRCPRCGAIVALARGPRGTISWDDAMKQFTVQLSLLCSDCGGNGAGLARIPVLIEDASSCSCGAKLRLREHKFTKETGGEVTFEAVYACPACSRTKPTVLRSLKQGLARVWRDTESVEVGLEGVKYKKR